MDENENQGQENTQPQGTEEQTASLGAEQLEGEGAVPPPAPERPWKKPAPTMIPVERFNEKVREYHTQAEEAAQLRRTLEDPEALEKHLETLRAKKQQTSTPAPIQLDASKFTDPRTGEFDGAAYMAERDRLVADQTIARARDEAVKAVQQARTVDDQRQAVDNLNRGFRAQVAESSKVNPEIAEAVGYLDQVATAGFIPGEVQLAILQSAPEVAYAIACDPQLLEQVARGNPVQSLVQIGRLQALHEAKAGKPDPAVEGAIPAFQPGRPNGFQAPRTAVVPRTLDGAPGGAINPAKLSQSEYNRLRSEGKI